MFVRSWLRAAFGAGGIVLLMPLGLVLALALAAAVGGASLDGLGQVLGGPRVSGLEERAPGVVRVAGADGGTEVPPIPVRSSARIATSSPRPPAPAASALPAFPRPESERGAGPAVAGPPAVGPPRRRPAAPPTVPAEAPPVTTPPPDAPAPRPLRELTQTVQETLRPVVPPVGPAAADAIGTVVELLAPPP